METAGEFPLESLEPLVNPIRQYRNRSKKQAAEDASGGGPCESPGRKNLANVLTKIANLQKANNDCIDRTKLVKTYNVKLRLKKTSLYKCFDCDSCFTNPDFLELHEKSHSASLAGPDEIDLCHEQSVDGNDTNLKQSVWFAGDIYDAKEQEDDEEMIHLDCTVEEREDNFDITFDRTKCEKTYTVKYKVQKEPVGKCERCEKLFYSKDSMELHKLEHERFVNFDAVEPKINVDSPNAEESTLVLNESFYQVLSEMDASDILEVSDSNADAKLSPRATEIRLEYTIVSRRASAETTNGNAKQPCIKQMPRTMPNPFESKYQCDVCAKQFRFRPAFNVHKHTHENRRPFRCNECGRGFTSKAKLFLHSYGHSRARKSVVECRKCNAQFAKPRELFEHLQRCHTVQAT